VPVFLIIPKPRHLAVVIVWRMHKHSSDVIVNRDLIPFIFQTYLATETVIGIMPGTGLASCEPMSSEELSHLIDRSGNVYSAYVRS
ncbi:hypothetical protein, partial [Vibrio cholerae]